jgi:hypothetical protein
MYFMFGRFCSFLWSKIGLREEGDSADFAKGATSVANARICEHCQPQMDKDRGGGFRGQKSKLALADTI